MTSHCKRCGKYDCQCYRVYAEISQKALNQRAQVGPADEDDLYTVQEFRQLCQSRALIDYDGHGYPVKNGLSDRDVRVLPSQLDLIPSDATHIVWYNR
jgi:hypothetical protein